MGNRYENNDADNCFMLYAAMGEPLGGKKDRTFFKTLVALLGLALVGAVLNLSDPFKSHTITVITRPGVQNVRALTSEKTKLDSTEFEGSDVAASGHSLLAEIPKKKSVFISRAEPVKKESDEENSLPKAPPPLTGLVTTHHKTGTVLFSTMLSTICSLIGADFQEVPGIIPLGNSTFEKSVKYFPAENADKRIATSMHGFKETCKEEHKCDRFDAQCRLSACQLIDKGDESYGVVHVVRNPLEILISAYLYHREMGSALVAKGLELWLLKDKSHLLPENMRERFKGVPYYKVLEELKMEEGIKVEFLVNGGQIFRAARNYRDLKSRAGVLNIHYEDLQNDYKGTMERVFENIHLSENIEMKRLLEVASLYDIQSMPKEMMSREVGTHITQGKFDKSILRKIIYEDQELRNVLDDLAKEMGYDFAFKKISTTEYFLKN